MEGDGGAGKKKKPSRSYLMPMVALGTVAGIAAAVAIFGPDDLSVGSMGSSVFTDGVDFGSLFDADMPTDCG